jgi:flagellar motor switch protein FliM
VQLNAVLARLSLPMADVLGLAAGMIVPLQDAVVDVISLEGTDGRCVAFGKLGQNRGMRALRLEDGQGVLLRKPVRAGRVLSQPFQNVPASRVPHNPHLPLGMAKSVISAEEGSDMFELRSTGTD